jgi:hypothetical protein
LNDMCIFWPINLVEKTYLTICSLEHIVKLDKNLTTLVKMANEAKSIETFNQVGHKQMTPLIKMANVIIVKWGILSTYLPYFTTFLPSYLPTYLLTYWPTYPPTYLLVYWPTHPPTHPHVLIITTYLPSYPPTYLPKYLFTYHLPTYWLIHPPTSYNIPTYIPQNLVTMCWNKHMK